jgi:hypothetical protein
MNDGNAIIVLLILIGIIVLVNGTMFLAVRGFARGNKTTRDVINSTKETVSRPFHMEDNSLEELRKRVEDLADKK